MRNQEFQEEKNRLVRAPHPHLLLQMVFVKMRPWRPKAKMRRWKPSNFILKPAHCVIYSNPVFLTGFFVLWSSSCVLQNSCSKEVASSLNKPTSSQFFRKRVGVGVWSAKKQKKTVSISGQKYHLQTQTIIYNSSIQSTDHLLSTD